MGQQNQTIKMKLRFCYSAVVAEVLFCEWQKLCNKEVVCYVCTMGQLQKTVQFHVYFAGKVFGIFI